VTSSTTRFSVLLDAALATQPIDPVVTAAGSPPRVQGD
jgi:hypothetical protein